MDVADGGSGLRTSLKVYTCRRSLRGGLRGFYVFICCIALGVMAISGVGSVAASLGEGLAREGRTVFVTGDAHAVIQVPCARCLKPLTISLDPQIDLSLLPALEDEEPDGEGELKDEALEEYTYSNDLIDVGAILNEQLLLEKPFRVLCDEECKGLCPSCGANLNEGACLCAPQPKSLAFAALKDFKPRN